MSFNFWVLHPVASFTMTSLWVCRQSQQFLFHILLFTSLHVPVSTGHPQVEYTRIHCRRNMCILLLYPEKLALTSPTSGGRSVGIVRSRTQTTELVIYIYVHEHI
jgi:hypothetical protein